MRSDWGQQQKSVVIRKSFRSVSCVEYFLFIAHLFTSQGNWEVFSSHIPSSLHPMWIQCEFNGLPSFAVSSEAPASSSTSANAPASSAARTEDLQRSPRIEGTQSCRHSFQRSLFPGCLNPVSIWPMSSFRPSAGLPAALRQHSALTMAQRVATPKCNCRPGHPISLDLPLNLDIIATSLGTSFGHNSTSFQRRSDIIWPTFVCDCQEFATSQLTIRSFRLTDGFFYCIKNIDRKLDKNTKKQPWQPSWQTKFSKLTEPQGALTNKQYNVQNKIEKTFKNQ